MITLEDYASRDGLALAALVESGEVAPSELAAAALAAIEKVDPKLHAVLQRLPDEAAAAIASGLPAGPFTGVPLAIKELGLHARGVALDMGSRFARGFIVDADTELMARFRRAGLVLIATTQVPEFAYSPTTESALHGATRNPWDPSRSAGGSSGGSGAAVASGMVPIAYGNDGAGSIRVPASCNGVVGLKPSRDRVPAGPDVGDSLCGLGCEFALTRSVRDAAALLDAVAGADVGAPGMLPSPARSFLAETELPPDRLRVAFSATPASGSTIDPECLAAVQATARLLADLGHDVVEGAPQYDWQDFLAATHVLFMSATAALIDGLAGRLARTPGRDNLEAVTLACYAEGKRLSAVDLHRALAWGNTASRATGAFFAGCDVLVTPTLPRPPIALGVLDQNAAGVTAWQWTERIFDYVCFTGLFNWTGQPAVSLPLHWTPDGLPVGVQLVTRFGEDALLLRVAAQLEQARPWSARRPPIHAAR